MSTSTASRTAVSTIPRTASALPPPTTSCPDLGVTIGGPTGVPYVAIRVVGSEVPKSLRHNDRVLRSFRECCGSSPIIQDDNGCALYCPVDGSKAEGVLFCFNQNVNSFGGGGFEHNFSTDNSGNAVISTGDGFTVEATSGTNLVTLGTVPATTTSGTGTTMGSATGTAASASSSGAGMTLGAPDGMSKGGWIAMCIFGLVSVLGFFSVI